MCLQSVKGKSQLICFSKILLWSQYFRKASISDFHSPSTCSGRALKIGFSAAILAVISSLTIFLQFLKSFSYSLYWEINSKVPFLFRQKPALHSTASTLSPEHNAIFISSGNNDFIILALPAILLMGVDKSEWKSRDSGMRIAAKQTLTRTIPIILIPDWFQTNTP